MSNKKLYISPRPSTIILTCSLHQNESVHIIKSVFAWILQINLLAVGLLKKVDFVKNRTQGADRDPSGVSITCEKVAIFYDSSFGIIAPATNAI